MTTTDTEIGTPENQLRDWALRIFLRAYGDIGRRRAKCSRQDFWAGYRSALMELKAWDHFQVPPF